MSFSQFSTRMRTIQWQEQKSLDIARCLNALEYDIERGGCIEIVPFCRKIAMPPHVFSKICSLHPQLLKIIADHNRVWCTKHERFVRQRLGRKAAPGLGFLSALTDEMRAAA